MNSYSQTEIELEDAADTRPILIIPYMWIGDFVRGHTVIRVLKQRWPNRPVDLLAFLQQAAREGRQVWLGYVDAQGQSTSRVVQPRTVEGGYVTAFDHLRHEDRTFSVHRITGVAEIEGDA